MFGGDDLTLRSEHLSWVGTDAAEWWLGFDKISRIARAQSIVLHRGDWRIVHSHGSIAVSNEEAMGFAITTSIDAIVDAVADEHHDVSDLVNEGLTIVFSGIESSTALAERLGDTAWVELLGRYDRLVRDLVVRRRFRVVKAMGDGYMLVSRRRAKVRRARSTSRRSTSTASARASACTPARR